MVGKEKNVNHHTDKDSTGHFLRRRNLVSLLVAILVIALIGWISSQWFFRIDLTTDKRFTLHPVTRKLLRTMDKDVYVRVFLDGEMPVGFKRLQQATRDMLTEFQAYGGRHFTYSFINPSKDDRTERQKIYNELYEKGLRPTDVQARDKEGGTSSKILFPGALAGVNNMEMAINFLNNNPTLPASVNLNHSIEGLEYKLTMALHNLTTDTIYKVAFTEGHGELPEPEVEDFQKALSRFYTIDRGVIGGQPGILKDYACVIIAKPTRPFSEADKLVLDQYLMNGGRILWLLDKVSIDADSLAYASFTFGLPQDLNLDDLLFKYGVRINPSLIQDVRCAMIPVNTAIQGNSPHYVPAPWLYYPLLGPQSNEITRNINLVKGEFVNPIDTVRGNGEINKTILLTSSQYARELGAPLMVNLEEIKNPPKEEEFNRAYIPTAVLLEGTFASAFIHRMTDAIIPGAGLTIKEKSVPTRMVVVACGNIARNDVQMSGNKVVSLPLGQDRITQQTYGNKDFLVNAVHYLTDDKGLLELRSQEFKLHLLDRTRISDHRFWWVLINTMGPLLIILIAGMVIRVIRIKKYGT